MNRPSLGWPEVGVFALTLGMLLAIFGLDAWVSHSREGIEGLNEVRKQLTKVSDDLAMLKARENMR